MPHVHAPVVAGSFLTREERVAMLALLPQLIAEARYFDDGGTLAAAQHLRTLLESVAPVRTRTALELGIEIDERKATFFARLRRRARGRQRWVLQACEDIARAYAADGHAVLEAMDDCVP